MKIDNLMEEYDPMMQEGYAYYSYSQVKEMLELCSREKADDAFKQQLIDDEEYRKEFTRNMIMQMRYCMPMPHPDMNFGEFQHRYVWNQEVSNSTVERMIRLITTGDADKPDRNDK